MDQTTAFWPLKGFWQHTLSGLHGLACAWSISLGEDSEGLGCLGASLLPSSFTDKTSSDEVQTLYIGYASPLWWQRMDRMVEYWPVLSNQDSVRMRNTALLACIPYANRQENDTHSNSSEWWGLNSSGSPQPSISPKVESDSTTTKIWIKQPKELLRTSNQGAFTSYP